MTSRAWTSGTPAVSRDSSMVGSVAVEGNSRLCITLSNAAVRSMNTTEYERRWAEARAAVALRIS
eukprot:4092291-Amphidinium_carterae.3